MAQSRWRSALGSACTAAVPAMPLRMTTIGPLSQSNRRVPSFFSVAIIIILTAGFAAAFTFAFANVLSVFIEILLSMAVRTFTA
jgi:hypothetical protein